MDDDEDLLVSGVKFSMSQNTDSWSHGSFPRQAPERSIISSSGQISRLYHLLVIDYYHRRHCETPDRLGILQSTALSWFYAGRLVLISSHLSPQPTLNEAREPTMFQPANCCAVKQGCIFLQSIGWHSWHNRPEDWWPRYHPENVICYLRSKFQIEIAI
jgi:hypothetical protein